MNDKKLKWYLAVFEAVGDDRLSIEEYITAESDEAAMSEANELAARGHDFVDVGHVDIELVSVSEVDSEQETFPEIRTIYY